MKIVNMATSEKKKKKKELDWDQPSKEWVRHVLLFLILLYLCLLSHLKRLKRCCEALVFLFCKLHVCTVQSYSPTIRLSRSSPTLPGLMGTIGGHFRSDWGQSGLWMSHSRTFTELSLSCSCVVLAASLGSLSCKKVNLQSSMNPLSIFIYHGLTGRKLTWCLTFWDFVPSAPRISGAQWSLWTELSNFTDVELRIWWRWCFNNKCLTLTYRQ